MNFGKLWLFSVWASCSSDGAGLLHAVADFLNFYLYIPIGSVAGSINSSTPAFESGHLLKYLV